MIYISEMKLFHVDVKTIREGYQLEVGTSWEYIDTFYNQKHIISRFGPA
jgi:hypothetical protein